MNTYGAHYSRKASTKCNRSQLSFEQKLKLNCFVSNVDRGSMRWKVPILEINDIYMISLSRKVHYDVSSAELCLERFRLRLTSDE